MKKATSRRRADELRPEYDLSKLRGGVRGKYYGEASAGTNLVLIEPDLAEVFPNAQSVNRALRALRDTAAAAVVRPGSAPPNKRLQRAAAKEKSQGKLKAHPGGGR
jgi:hypothetical protein